MVVFKALLMDDSVARERVLGAATPGDAKAFGRQISQWNEALWRQERFEAICLGTKLKFTQNASLGEYLLQTGDRCLAEASPYDTISGLLQAGVGDDG